MSARDELMDKLTYDVRQDSEEWRGIVALLDDHRAEVLREAADEMDAHCEKFGVLGVGDRLRRMADAAEQGEKDTREGVDAPQPAADLPLWLNSPIECPHCAATQQNCDTCGVDMYQPTDEGDAR